ncbi:MAG: HAMP domain-containing histidine kinase [Bacteroidetes bacterium]|nr:HAMP domain-containing histidine kinase [Bacteroidota bacterium]
MKLTHHISFRYIGITALVLLLSIPIFYFILQKVMWNSFDENLDSQQKWIEETLKKTAPENFVSFNNNIIIRPGNFPNKKRKFYTENVYVPDDEESVPFRVLEFNTSENGKDYAVRIQKSLVESEDLLQTIAILQAFIFFILMTTLLLINRKLKFKIWNPFYQTLERLEKFKLDTDVSLDLPQNSITEINDLNQSINVLTARNIEVFQAQKEFTENASHEMQTPLAILQSNVDLLWQTQPLSEEQTKILENLTETNSRISRLNKALLLIAKIDNQQFSDKKNIDIQVLVENILEKNRESFFHKNIDVRVKVEGQMIVTSDETLMEILFGNLISNAFRYSPKNTTIDIMIKSNQFSIENQAVDGTGLDTQKLFRRFQKQEHFHKNSIGLGLEICKKICEQNSMKIQYAFLNNKHEFRILV